MAYRAIPMIAFPRVQSIYIDILVCVCIAYVVLQVVSFWGVSQLRGVVHKRTCRLYIDYTGTARKTAGCENCKLLIYQTNIIKMMQKSLKKKRKTNSYDRLLSFRHEEVISNDLGWIIERLGLRFHRGPSIQCTQKNEDTSAVMSDNRHKPIIGILFLNIYVAL